MLVIWAHGLITYQTFCISLASHSACVCCSHIYRGTNSNITPDIDQVV